jgi:hypothetical protein
LLSGEEDEGESRESELTVKSPQPWTPFGMSVAVVVVKSCLVVGSMAKMAEERGGAVGRRRGRGIRERAEWCLMRDSVVERYGEGSRRRWRGISVARVRVEVVRRLRGGIVWTGILLVLSWWWWVRGWNWRVSLWVFGDSF